MKKIIVSILLLAMSISLFAQQLHAPDYKLRDGYLKKSKRQKTTAKEAATFRNPCAYFVTFTSWRVYSPPAPHLKERGASPKICFQISKSFQFKVETIQPQRNEATTFRNPCVYFINFASWRLILTTISSVISTAMQMPLSASCKNSVIRDSMACIVTLKKDK